MFEGDEGSLATASDAGRSGEASAGRVLVRKRTAIVAVQIAMVLALLLTWLLSEGVRASKNLWVLFFYSFPSEFLVGLVPHEPVLIFFGAFWPAWIVALVATLSTLLAEAMNYSVFGYFYERPSLHAISDHRSVRKIMELFGRAPFGAILFAGFTPVPFFPIRMLVVMTSYPLWKYALGVLLSRLPRFFILAAFGAYFDIPVGLLGGLFLLMLLSVNVPTLIRLTTGGKDDRQ
ncbi:MAG: VTT domain-containing protein [Gemmatimonadota bacterium]|nr:VTT domain-containing protein [Gemmatimonadota bacterium]